MTALRIAVAREAVADSASPDALDTVRQAVAVGESLGRAGWEAVQVVLGDDPLMFLENLRSTGADAVFNLVESHCGLASLACAAPALCRKAGLPFTGAGEGAMALAGDKDAARRVMAAAGIPAPAGTGIEALRQGRFPGAGRYIVKARFEDASLGLGTDCVVEVRDEGGLLAVMEALAPRMGGDCVAERYVDGREFNLALLAGPDGAPRALPLAEMVFDPGLPGPAILHYAAKWEEGGADYAASARSFETEGCLALAAEMERIGLRCWEVFGLAGYARVDFRVSAGGEIFVIDINPNPCIAPDSGFAAAARQGGIDHTEAVRRIVLDALRRAGRMEPAHG